MRLGRKAIYYALCIVLCVLGVSTTLVVACLVHQSYQNWVATNDLGSLGVTITLGSLVFLLWILIAMVAMSISEEE